MTTKLVTWVLSMMTFLAPPESVPWRDTYEATARGIVQGAQEVPVFDGPDGVERTIALDVALAFFESTFRFDAVGDHGQAKSLYQVHGAPPTDPREATTTANRIIRASFRACAAHPLDERLAWYASGGPTCTREGGVRASKHRVGLAMRLFKKFPPPADAQP